MPKRRRKSRASGKSLKVLLSAMKIMGKVPNYHPVTGKKISDNVKNKLLSSVVK